MNAYIQYLEKTQAEFLNGLKQAQELSLKSVATVTGLVAAVPTPEAKEVQTMTVPTATELVERSFAFTQDVLNARKEYLVKLADLATEANKTFAETAKRFAEQTKSVETTIVNAATKNGTTATQTVTSKN